MDREIKTHKLADRELCGNPVVVRNGFSKVELRTTTQMVVDNTGLVHGGFIFGLADYSAMIAVNHPNVVLGAADVKFVKPVKADELIVAEATVEPGQGKKKKVCVTAFNIAKEKVFDGIFICFILEKHVLD